MTVSRFILSFTTLALCATSVTSCATPLTFVAAPKAVIDFYCGDKDHPGAYVAVDYSRHDTDYTIAQTKENNAVHDATCPPGSYERPKPNK